MLTHTLKTNRIYDEKPLINCKIGFIRHILTFMHTAIHDFPLHIIVITA